MFTIDKITPLLVIFLLLACAPSPESTRVKTEETAPALEEPVPEEKPVFEGPGKKLPNLITSWTISSAPRYFGPDNLYDLINGGAEIYRDFGLTKMVTADYASPKHPGLTVSVEIYDHGTVANAFGRTARFLSNLADPAKAGVGLPPGLEGKGLFGGTDLVFYKDRYLTHITLLDESPDATPDSMKKAGREILPAFASAVASNISEDPPPPAELSIFPPAYRIDRSEAFEPKALAQITELGSGFSVRYKKDDLTWTLFATESLGDPKAIETTIREQLKQTVDPLPRSFVTAGSSIVGFVVDGQPGGPSNAAIPKAQLQVLKAAFEKPATSPK